MQTMLFDSTETLVSYAKDIGEIPTGSPHRGRQIDGGKFK